MKPARLENYLISFITASCRSPSSRTDRAFRAIYTPERPRCWQSRYWAKRLFNYLSSTLRAFPLPAFRRTFSQIAASIRNGYSTLIYNGVSREPRERGRGSMLVLTRRTEERVVFGGKIDL